MTPAERLVDEIMAASRIPSAKRRREVVRELRAHVEDFVTAARQSGRSEAEIERLLLDRFGDPRQIARQFAWVCRRERAAMHFGGFLISALVVSLIISAAAIPLQAAMLFGFGAPAFGSHHTLIGSCRHRRGTARCVCRGLPGTTDCSFRICQRRIAAGNPSGCAPPGAATGRRARVFRRVMTQVAARVDRALVGSL